MVYSNLDSVLSGHTAAVESKHLILVNSGEFILLANTQHINILVIPLFLEKQALFFN